MGTSIISVRKNLLRIFGASIIIGFVWGIWISTPITLLPIRILEAFGSFVFSIFLMRKLSDEKADKFFMYIYDNGVKTLTIAAALAGIAITFTFSSFSSNFPLNATLPLANMTITKQQIVRDLILASSNLIGLFIPLIGVYLSGFANYLLIRKETVLFIRFISLWFFMMAVLMFIESVTTLLRTIRFFVYAYFP